MEAARRLVAEVDRQALMLKRGVTRAVAAAALEIVRHFRKKPVIAAFRAGDAALSCGVLHLPSIPAVMQGFGDKHGHGTQQNRIEKSATRRCQRARIASTTVNCRGCNSIAACSKKPAIAIIRCSSGCAFCRSRRRTSTNFTWCAPPACTARSRPASRRCRKTA